MAKFVSIMVLKLFVVPPARVGTVLRLRSGPVDAWLLVERQGLTITYSITLFNPPPCLVAPYVVPPRKLLVDKTDQLNQQAFRFDRASRSLRRTMYWRKVKTGVAAAAVGVALMVAAGATACGGVTFSHCRS